MWTEKRETLKQEDMSLHLRSTSGTHDSDQGFTQLMGFGGSHSAVSE